MIVYVCVSNAGKSQMAEALHRLHSDIPVYSCGVQPKGSVNQESARAVEKLGATMGTVSKGLEDVPIREADRVIVLGADAQLPEDIKYERWLTDEPSLRGIEGEERMDLIAADIDARVRNLLAKL